MAYFLANRAIDMRNLPDAYAARVTSQTTTELGFTLRASDASTTTLTVQGYGFRTESVEPSDDPWSLPDLFGGRLLGTVQQLSVSTMGELAFSVRNADYQWGNAYYESGYSYDGETLYGLRGELAALLAGDDSFNGKAGTTNYFEGFAGNDVLNVIGTNDTFDGGEGTDTAYFGHTSRDRFDIKVSASGQIVVTEKMSSEGPAKTTTLIDVERLQFLQDVVAYDVDGNAGDALRMIATLGGDAYLGKKGVVGEIVSYLDQMTVSQLAEAVVSNGLVAQLAGSSSDEALIQLMYTNITGQRAGASDLAWNLSYMRDNNLSQAEAIALVVSLDATAEAASLDSFASSGISYTAFW